MTPVQKLEQARLLLIESQKLCEEVYESRPGNTWELEHYRDDIQALAWSSFDDARMRLDFICG